jgi:hypothetical protein
MTVSILHLILEAAAVVGLFWIAWSLDPLARIRDILAPRFDHSNPLLYPPPLPTRAALEAMNREDALRATWRLARHPDGYTGPCACETCAPPVRPAPKN